MSAWTTGYHHAVPKVSFRLSTSDSGVSIVDTANTTDDLGASSSPLSTYSTTSTPQLLNIPIAISAVAVEFNLPGITSLRLTPKVLAYIYEGLITNWDDPLIAALNPRVPLPTEIITTLHRSDGSGATNTLTQYLSQALPKTWGSPHGVGSGYLVQWPTLPQQQALSSNSAMATTCAATPGCITYVQTLLPYSRSGTTTASASTLGQAQLENPAGTFVSPSRHSVDAEAKALPNALPSNEGISLVSTAAVNGYPLASFEFAIVSNRQSGPVRSHALRSVLSWIIDPAHGGSITLLRSYGLLPLPFEVRQLSLSQIRRIGPKY
jgi:phosphate transport system substrate-binding protein